MVIFFIIFGLSEVTTEVIQKDLYVRGSGVATSEILHKNGDYALIENVIFEDGPTTIKEGFTDMSSLQTITFSKTISQFIGGCFFRNVALKKFIVSQDNPYLWTDGVCLYQDNNKTLIGVIYQPNTLKILATVETLWAHCFSNVQYSNEILLPKSIRELSYQTFVECVIESIRFESQSSLEIIPEKSIQFCTINNFEIPPSVKEIHYLGFYYCTSPKLHFGDVENSKLTLIATEAFSSCACTDIVLPPGVREIPDKCFLSSSLQSLRIPAACTKISESAFAGCSALKSVTVDPSSTSFKEVSGSLFSFDMKQLVFAPPQLEAFEIPPELESISQSIVQSLVKIDRITIKEGNNYFSTFDGCLHDKSGATLLGVCGGVKLLNISEKTITISDQACKGVSITSVTFLGERCTKIGNEVFSLCKMLTEFCVPRGLQYIGGQCFEGSGLTSFTYESDSSLNYIGASTFKDLSLKVLKLPKSLQLVGWMMLGYSYIEVFELEQGSTLTSIQGHCFRNLNCKEGNSIVIPNTLTEIQMNAFQNCQLEISFEKGSTITSLPDSVFSGCTRIKGTFMIPSKIQTISNSAFADCINLEKIEFEEGSMLETVFGSAFKGCSKLKTLELPATVVSFDCSAINGCFSLTEFTVDSKNEHIYAEENILYTKDKAEVIVCSPGNINAYVSKDAKTIRSNGFYQCSKLTNVIFNSPSKLESISQNTFAGCTNLASILLPTKLRELLDSAFSGCEKLEKVTFDVGSELTKIGQSVFSGCAKLKIVLFDGSSLLEIGNTAFEDCTALSSIDIPASVQHLGAQCFKSSGLKSLNLRSLSKIGDGCFQSCSLLESASIEGLAQISNSLFEGCSSLKSISLPPNLEVMGSRCLAGTVLGSIVIPSNVVRIETGCFANSAKLIEVNISSNCLNEIQQDCFVGCPVLSRVIYCGTNTITGDCGLDDMICIVYVNVNYTGTQFCGLRPRRQLREGCVFVDPTASPSGVFTAFDGELQVNLLMITSAVIDPHDEECGK